ncbi:MAG TPA: isochorismate synthase [Dehalococcoidia bacterium]|nr:isochorismate synthase [Dehalococcoidia bacterium]
MLATVGARARLSAPRLRRLPDLDLLPLLPPDVGPAFYWERPSRGIALLALGSVAEVRPRGARRLASVVRWWRRVLPAGLPPHLPVAVGGFAFQPRRARDDLWRPFGDALWWVPRLLLARLPQGSWAALFAADEGGLEGLAEAPADGSSPPRPSPPAWDDDFRPAVAAALARLQHGEAEKVVLARRLRLGWQRPCDPRTVLDRLRAAYPECTVFALGRGGRWFLGATPETLLEMCDGRVRTDCLAGSAPRGRTPSEDEALAARLLSDPKERQEHALVVAAVREALAPICRRLDLPPQPRVRRLANIQHLHTPVAGELARPLHLLQVAERLHPTPAVAGYPRGEALAIIQRLEGFDRGWYAGAVGWLDPRGGGELALAIRSALVGRDGAVLYAGCGITAASDPWREEEESRLKLRAMLGALGVA